MLGVPVILEYGIFVILAPLPEKLLAINVVPSKVKPVLVVNDVVLLAYNILLAV